MSGAEIAAEAAAAIREASAEVGAGTPLTATLVRPGVYDETTYTTGEPTPYTLDVLVTEYSARDRMGTDITTSDRKIMVTPDAPVVPKNGDTLSIAGESYSVQEVMPYQPGGVTLYYHVRARAGG